MKRKPRQRRQRIAGWAGLSSVFLAGGLIVLCAGVIAGRLLLVPGPD